MLANILDEFIVENRGLQEHLNDKFRVSDAGRCRLMRFWKRQGKPATDIPDARTYRIFEVGIIFHEWLQDLLTEKGILIEKEKEVEDIHRRGHIDAIVKNGERLVLYDFKTVHSRKFNYLKAESDIHYHFQVVTYAMMLPYGVEEIRIAYISKDDLRIMEVPVNTDGIEEGVRKDWDTLLLYWQEQKAPPPNPKDWECKYCIYRSSCEYSRNRK